MSGCEGISVEAKWYVVVAGDWHSVVSMTRKNDLMFETVIRQKPDSEEDAEYREYHFEFSDSAELLSLIQLAVDANLKWCVAVDGRSEKANFYAASDDMWSNNGAHGVVYVKVGGEPDERD